MVGLERESSALDGVGYLYISKCCWSLEDKSFLS